MPKGGKRQGAGRPKLPHAKKRVTFRLSQENLDRLEGEKNKSGLIDKLLTQYFERNEK